jgi:predicted NACHT family NTPase
MKQLLGMICLTVLLMVSIILFAQDYKSGPAQQPDKPIPNVENRDGMGLKDWISIVGLTIALISLSLSLYQLLRLKKYAKLKKIIELIAEDEYKKRKEEMSSLRESIENYFSVMKDRLGTIYMSVSPDIDSNAVKLKEAFIDLHLSKSWKMKNRFDFHNIVSYIFKYHLPSLRFLKRALKKYRLLLIIGGPGSGKTTLLKYYAMSLFKNYKDKDKENEFDFPKEMIPIYIHLRELEYDDINDEPLSLQKFLEKLTKKHDLDISKEQFHTWFHRCKTLVLFDGLDEISTREKCKKVCKWIRNMCNDIDFKNSNFVVTSRATGYLKQDGIEFGVKHFRAYIKHFNNEQQENFLEKWFRAVHLSELRPVDMDNHDWKQQQKKNADQSSKSIIEFLKHEKNRAVKEFAAVPMLLQIIAIIWKKTGALPPKKRVDLYDVALNYILDYRDQQKGIDTLLTADEARRVLAPTALDIQKSKKDVVPKKKMNEIMMPILETLDEPPCAGIFCFYLINRVGLLDEFDKNNYIFSHRSFQEYLAAKELIRLSDRGKLEIDLLINNFKNVLWEETLRFFMAMSDAEVFNEFMRLFFESEISHNLKSHQKVLLKNLVSEARQKKIDVLVELLESKKLSIRQRRYVKYCLKIIGTPEAIEAIDIMEDK